MNGRNTKKGQQGLLALGCRNQRAGMASAPLLKDLPQTPTFVPNFRLNHVGEVSKKLCLVEASQSCPVPFLPCVCTAKAEEMVADHTLARQIGVSHVERYRGLVFGCLSHFSPLLELPSRWQRGRLNAFAICSSVSRVFQFLLLWYLGCRIELTKSF